MYITSHTIVTAGAVLAAVTAFISMFVALINWLNKQKKQDVDIKKIKKEMTLVCYCMSACLDGLTQLGCNHTVPGAKDKLDKYINKAAHDQAEEE